MTLTKTKPRRTPADERKRHGQHHHHSQHYLKTYWPYLPIAAIITLGLAANTWLGSAHRSVLGYATDMSVSSLLSDTNAQRQANGEDTLNLNGQLNNAAQAKANDMAARDYWSHNTPDGKTPWTFIVAAGYSYQTAGENLAYGFDTAADTLTGWMNSPEHRANILNTTYRDVGFGIANIADYQNSGPETLVVAMYASPAAAAAPISSPAATAPAAQPHNQPAATQPAAAPSTQHDGAKDSQPATTPVATTAPAVDGAKDTAPVTIAEPEQHIARIQLLAANTSWSVLLVALIGLVALGAVLLRHTLAWHKVLVRGERFALHHPVIDMLAVAAVAVSVVLSHTAGLIK
ncbi:MAG TPA: CAP domain-containing protein [Candidatus Saccharimonadales bacterium]|nr:CAP domain-containing protein [Candidatus Saccharimonadales bacterium]